MKADAKTKVYGSVDPGLSYTVTVGNLVGSDTLAGSLNRGGGENVGSYAITSTLANGNYEVTYVGDNLTITAAPFEITTYKPEMRPDEIFQYVKTLAFDVDLGDLTFTIVDAYGKPYTDGRASIVSPGNATDAGQVEVGRILGEIGRAHV